MGCFEDSLKEVSTPNAEYDLNLVRDHSKPQERPLNIQQYDGIILESGSIPYEEFDLDTILNDVHYQDLFKHIPSIAYGEEVPETLVYAVDIPDSNYDFTSLESILFEINPLRSLNLEEITEDTFLESYTERAKFSSFFTTFGMRSAAMAHKAEEHVASELDDVINQKPRIFVNYGKGHSDISLYLDNENLRDKVLDFHERLDFLYKDEEYMNKVCEISFPGGDLLHPETGIRYDKTTKSF